MSKKRTIDEMVAMVSGAISRLKRDKLRTNELGTMAHSMRHECSVKELIVVNTNDNIFMGFHAQTGITALTVIKMCRDENREG